MSIIIPRPDDFHVHLRRGDLLRTVVPYTAAHFGRALIMPNTDPPILTAEDVVAYRAEILAAVPEGIAFSPLMTIDDDQDYGCHYARNHPRSARRRRDCR